MEKDKPPADNYSQQSSSMKQSEDEESVRLKAISVISSDMDMDESD